MSVLLEGAMSVREAAQLLGVTEKHVQHLGRAGELQYVARGLLDSASVRTFQAVRQGKHTRGWSTSTAWAAIALLSGEEANWLGQAQTSRLRSRLREIDSGSLISAARNRALIGRFSGHPAAANRISQGPGTVVSRSLPGLVRSAEQLDTDWYVDAREEERVVHVYGLRADVRGDYVLRAVKARSNLGHGVTMEFVELLMGADDVLIALDSATASDPRRRGVAIRVLDDALRRYR